LAKIGSLLGGFANLVGKNTVIGKGLAIASATIDTYQGATAALKATAGLPFIGTAMGIANAALIVGNGIKNVREIIKTKVPNASDNSGGGHLQRQPLRRLRPPFQPRQQWTEYKVDISTTDEGINSR
jgi:hypothetical protein